VTTGFAGLEVRQAFLRMPLTDIGAHGQRGNRTFGMGPGPNTVKPAAN
jgi:hypothetical protein